MKAWIVRASHDSWINPHWDNYGIEFHVTPLPTREEIDDLYFRDDIMMIPSSHGVWMACYDYLTGHKEEESKPVGEMTKAQRREWIYG